MYVHANIGKTNTKTGQGGVRGEYTSRLLVSETACMCVCVKVGAIRSCGNPRRLRVRGRLGRCAARHCGIVLRLWIRKEPDWWVCAGSEGGQRWPHFVKKYQHVGLGGVGQKKIQQPVIL